MVWRIVVPAMVLLLCACQNGTHTAARRCEHATGSLLCTNADDMPVGTDTSAPGITTPFNGQKGN